MGQTANLAGFDDVGNAMGFEGMRWCLMASKHAHACTHTERVVLCLDYYWLACVGAGPGVALSYFSWSVGWWLLGADIPMPMSGLSYFAHSK